MIFHLNLFGDDSHNLIAHKIKFIHISLSEHLTFFTIENYKSYLRLPSLKYFYISVFPLASSSILILGVSPNAYIIKTAEKVSGTTKIPASPVKTNVEFNFSSASE